MLKMMLSDELESIWKETATVQSVCYFNIFLIGLKETIRSKTTNEASRPNFEPLNSQTKIRNLITWASSVDTNTNVDKSKYRYTEQRRSHLALEATL